MGDGDDPPQPSDTSIVVDHPSTSTSSKWWKMRAIAMKERAKISRIVTWILIGEVVLILTAIVLMIIMIRHIPTASSPLIPTQLHYPTFGYLIVILCLCIMSIVSVMVTRPLLTLPYISSSFVTTGALIVLAVNGVRVTVWYFSTLHLLFPIFIIILTLFEIVALFFKVAYFRKEMKTKKTVTGCPDPSEPKRAESTPPLSAKSQSFSRRSTLIISDDFFEPPPKM